VTKSTLEALYARCAIQIDTFTFNLYRVCLSVCLSRLITYPPPPAVGGITVHNEDLYCLNDGEFLNDVVIEFYIKLVLLLRLYAFERPNALNFVLS